MKRLTPILIMICLFSTTINAQNEYTNSWDQVYKFEVDNLPKSALKIVDGIYTKAKKQNNTSQLIKALFYKSKFSLTLEEDAQLKIINQFKEHITTSNFPTKNVLENVLANLYWQYFNQNRWKFYNRTQTTIKADKDDFRTWDLTTLFHEIHSYFEASLEHSSQLQKIKISEFSDILQMTKDTKSLQPTLFDFLAYNSLEFYKTSETAITKPTYEFKIDNKHYIGNSKNFSKLNLTSKDSLSLQFNALKTYQKLLQFHSKENNLPALVNYDIERLAFVNKHGTYPNKQKLFLEALNTEKKRYHNNEVSGLYAYQVAKIYNELANSYDAEKNETHQFKNKEALTICNDILKKFPKSLGAKKCESLKNNITKTELNIIAEKHISVSEYSRVLVGYKNVSELYFSIHKIDIDQIERLHKIYNTEKQYAFLKKLPKIEEWNSTLKSVGDYQKHTTEIGLPKLSRGNYVILASPKKEFKENSTFAFTNIQVTNIAFVLNHQQENNYQVVDRNTGAPLINAKVNLSNDTRSRHNRPINRNFVTNKNGEFTFAPNREYYANVTATINYKDDEAIFTGFYINPKHRNANNSNRTHTETFLFTDRSIYRPGQTVYFKGISLETTENKSTVKAEKVITVTLKDVNYQTVKEIELKTNEFGSFSSSFILPSQGLSGQFVIEASIENRRNNTYISVEEYKRPKFETAFKPVTETIKVNDEVKVTGFAKSFAGTSITDAKVVYRVHRKVVYPRWWYWYKPYFTSHPKEILQGKVTTDKSGNFSIVFNAIPDDSADKKTQPVFTYEVTADVTDINGETRSATTEVKVGYHALLADIEIPNNINKLNNETNISFSTKNLNGENIESSGSVNIFKLKAPQQVLRKRPWNAPDYQVISKKEFSTKYPHDAYTNEDNYLHWEKGLKVFSSEFNTANKSEQTIKGLKKWASGKYVAILKTKDKFGQTVEAKQFFTLSSLKDELPFDQQLISVIADKKEYKIGDTATITVSSNSEDISLVLLIEKNQNIFEKHYVHLNKNRKKFSVPVTEEDLGGFGIEWYFVQYNSFQKGQLDIAVPYPKTDLEIITNTFRDKLQPGEKQTWSFTVKGPKKEKVTAELLAGMYDASLDAFKPHQWNFSPIQKPIYRSYNNANAGVSFGNTNFNVKNLDRARPLNYKPNYTKYNWFGLNLNNQQWSQREYVRTLKFQKTKFDKKISGIVEDESGPLSGATVLIKGTTYGTETDFDGRFILNVNKGDILVFSFVGMKTIEKKVDESNHIIAQMEADGNLDEVVAVGLGYSSGSPRRKMARMAESTVMLVETEDVQEEFDAPVNAPAPLNNEGGNPKKTDFSGVQIRKNLQETAFFYPQLTTDSEGNISFNFTVPEALTKWKLQLLAHNKDLYSSTKTLETVTQKELMVTPNAPRFLRHGDKITISAKVSNLSDKNLSGISKLILTNPISGKEINLLQNSVQEQSFSVDINGNTEVSWSLYIPETIDAVQYKIVAKAGDFSDGEQNALPVLSNRILVTETLPMWVRSKESKTFNLDKLKNNTSTSLKNHQLTLEVTSNPAWYAVQSLPYLMEYPHECSEQIFARFYANTLASHIANSNPRIQEVFNQWKSSEALLSNLEKNQELKSLIIQETPWLRDAQSETEQKKRIALLFDLNKLSNEQQSAIRKLQNMQLSNGGFPWFKGGYYPNSYITLHIASGFGHLKKLGISNFDNIADNLIKKSVRFLDKEIGDIYKDVQKEAHKIKERDGEKKSIEYLKKDHLSNFIVQYLYARSFYTDITINSDTKKAISFYTEQTSRFWKKTDLYSQGLMAIINHRSNQKETASKILKSLKENSITSEEMGMYWKANKPGWYWHQAPIETQALLIEAFSEIENDTQTIDNLKIWLLKNKQVSQWKTTKATTEAVYALLLQGSDWLSSTELVDVTVGKKVINPEQNPEIKLEAGTGYYKTSWSGEAIQKGMGTVTMSSKGETVAWGGLYWQYFEDLDKITSAKTPLQLKKKVFKKVNSDTGKKLIEITNKTTLKVGDLLTIRIELRSDRDMDFIHMKDMRASGVEPINVLSEYKWQDGLGYYQSTKDAATNFFFSRLPKGVYVFEYDVRANNAGNFSNGITSIQSMYAPEFTSHSNGIRISIEK
ncbi:Alpha-2-macroglobulin family N-terminal region [Tenacibaculum sp. MAR_2009_124]|uniref:alpha-2-macroglobulin family protein n=1 Tax=Tenacibaculum sp. MAR_2009_124 TaxID=1250059 RepID=UPI000895D7BD|nr:alpha-2-macroglobulin family protein [Tenacibaculum sp. MAR_2009_124]SEB76879.1 Alpha-2-macroglobulin family N-terminal region [Tenacibaculum sp. MAR_2009_124]